jgi:hypothetical protein
MTSAYCEEEAKAPALNYEHPIIGLLPHCINPRDPRAIPDQLDTSVVVPISGQLRWHVNPSTRPFVGAERRIPGAIASEPYRTDSYRNEEETRSSQLPQQEGDDRPTFADRAFTVTEAENAQRLVISFQAHGPADDFDLELFRRNADGGLTSLGTSGQPGGLAEEIVLEGDDMKPGDYVLRVKNYLALEQTWVAAIQRFTGTPETVIPGTREAWTLTCSMGSKVLTRREVFVKRGETVSLTLPCGRP